jgi:flagellar protein FlaI
MGYLDKLVQEAKKTKEPEAQPAQAKPAAEAAQEPEQADRTLIASYGDVKIYKVAGKPLLFYRAPLLRSQGREKELIDTLREIATRVITVDPMSIKDPQRRRNVFFEKVVEIIEGSPELHVPVHNKEFFAEAVVREMVGYGLLDPLIKDDQLEEIMVIGPNKPVYVFHRHYDMMETNAVFYEDKEIKDIIDKIARIIGRRIDIQNPMLDARLPDGTRVNATVPPASIDGSTVTLRKFREDPLTIVDLVTYGTLNTELAAFLWLAVDGMGVKPANMLISGGTASGKTTTLNVLSSFIPADERIVTIEDLAELNLPIEHWIRLEARPPGLEGTGEITLDMLMKNALRMRPDRVIVGEVRHAEAFTLFTALNTGHEGMGTVHANSGTETLVRLTNPPMNVPTIMLSALNFIVVHTRVHDRRKGMIRRISEVCEVSSALEGRPQLETLFQWDAAEDKLHRMNAPSIYLQVLQRYTGLSKQDVETDLAEREEIIKSLVQKGMRSAAEVNKVTREYTMRKVGR